MRNTNYFYSGLYREVETGKDISHNDRVDRLASYAHDGAMAICSKFFKDNEIDGNLVPLNTLFKVADMIKFGCGTSTSIFRALGFQNLDGVQKSFGSSEERVNARYARKIRRLERRS